MAKTKHPILNEYNLLKESFNQNPLASAVTDIIINIHNKCQNELKSKQKHNLIQVMELSAKLTSIFQMIKNILVL